MAQMALFETTDAAKQVWNRDEMAFTVSNDQTRILRDIMRLYNEGDPFDADVTYSKGVFYKKLPQPRWKFDLNPQREGVQEADARDLPLDDGSVRSLVFDPPFKASNSQVKGIIEARFSAFPSIFKLWDFYEESMREFFRVLKPKGIVVFKVQDTVSSGQNHMSHFEVEKIAQKIGFATLDLFILQARSVLLSPNMARQKHARKTHSFVFVFQKPRYQ